MNFKNDSVIFVIFNVIFLNSWMLFLFYNYSNHRYQKAKIDCLSFVYVPATSAAHNKLLFFFFCCRHLQYKWWKHVPLSSLYSLDVYDSNFDKIVYFFNFFLRNFILFTFSALPSNGSNYDYAKWMVPFPELRLGWKFKCVINIYQNESFNGTPHFCIFLDYRGHQRKGVAIFNADQINF